MSWGQLHLKPLFFLSTAVVPATMGTFLCDPRLRGTSVNDDAAASQPADYTRSPNYKWWVVGMLWFICFFNYADRLAISATLPLLRAEFGFDEEQLGVISSAFGIIYGLMAPLAGYVGDKFNRKYLILLGLYVWSLITGLTAVCTKFWHFVFVRGSEGLGETFYFPASMSLVSDYHSRKTRSRAMSIHQTSVYVGIVGGGWLAGWMGETFSWKVPFLVYGGLGMLLGLVLWAFIREPERNEAERLEFGSLAELPPQEPVPISRFLKEITRTPTLLFLLFAFCGANSVASIFMNWTILLMVDKFQISTTQASFDATFYIQLASVIGAVIGGYMADHLRRKFAGGRILVQGLGLALGAPFIYLCTMSENRLNFIVFIALFGLFKGIYDSNIWASMFDVISPSRRGATVGIANMAGWGLGSVISMLVGSAVKRLGLQLDEAMASSSVVYIIVAFLLIAAAFYFAPRDVHRSDVTATDPA